MLLVHPVVSSGLMDDWSYVRTAEVLAQTGHIHYNGWATAMLGWPLYPAALFIRLFGDSFTVVRSTVWVLASLCAAMLHRILLRAGVNRWNAFIGTSVFTLCPVFLVTSVVFQSDVPGLFTVLVCFYCSLRALQSQNNATLWVASAALGNLLLGTCRQIAWLGVLVMVPSTIYLLRQSRRLVLIGMSCVLVSALAIYLSLHWFNGQVYSVQEKIPLDLLRMVPWYGWFLFLARVAFEAMLLMLPLAVACFPVWHRAPRRLSCGLLVGLLSLLPLMRLQEKRHLFREWLAPFFLFTPAQPLSLDTVFTNIQLPIKGHSPVPLANWERMPLTLVCVFALAAVLAAVVDGWNRAQGGAGQEGRRQLLILSVPYTGCYLLLLTPRGLLSATYDRYFLLLLPPLLVLAIRGFQDFVTPLLPRYSVAVLAPVALYSVFTLHDVFASYRAVLTAANEVRATGVPRTQIDGGWEYNHYTELLATGVILQPGALMPDGKRVANLHNSVSGPCSLEVPEWTPSLHPRFTIAYPNSLCRPVPGFAPVPFRTWLPPFHRTALVAQYVPGKGERWNEPPVSGAHAPGTSPQQ